MLTIEKVNELLSIPINCEDGRLMRLMSCDNLIKTMFIFYSSRFSMSANFEERLKSCILEFTKLVTDLLDNGPGKNNRNYLLSLANKMSILPTKEIITNAMNELRAWYSFLEYIPSNHDISMLYTSASSLSMINYTVLANFCGITDFCKHVNNSKTLRRFTNFQEQTQQVYKGNMSLEGYLSEVTNHLAYLDELDKIFTDFNLTEYDFLTFMLLFDIRKNRSMLSHKKH